MSASTSTGKVRDYESQLRGHTVLILKTETGLIAKSLCTEGTYSRYFKVYVSDTFGNYQNLTVTDAVGACDVLVHRPPVFRNLSAAISQKGYSPMSYLGQKMPDKEIPKGTPGIYRSFLFSAHTLSTSCRQLPSNVRAVVLERVRVP